MDFEFLVNDSLQIIFHQTIPLVIGHKTNPIEGLLLLLFSCFSLLRMR
jgi:hypothetical protein